MRTLNTVLLVLLSTVYQLHGTGRDGQMKYFRKPWFSTLIMFVAMLAVLPYAYLEDYIRNRRRRRTQLSPAGQSEEAEQPLLPHEHEPKVVYTALIWPYANLSMKSCTCHRTTIPAFAIVSLICIMNMSVVVRMTACRCLIMYLPR